MRKYTQNKKSPRNRQEIKNMNLSKKTTLKEMVDKLKSCNCSEILRILPRARSYKIEFRGLK